MAHIVVYLQRTPQGLHPGSAIALCWARDIASERGASVTAVSLGDTGGLEDPLARVAGQFGADAWVLSGEAALDRVCERLHPVHTLVPWTAEGLEAAARLPMGPPTPRWVQKRHPPFGGADAVSAVLAGTLPWHDLPAVLDPEIERGSSEVDLPPWTKLLPTQPFTMLAEPRLGFVACSPVGEETVRQLDRGGFSSTSIEAVLEAEAGTVLWLTSAEGSPLPDALADRAPGVRVVLLSEGGRAADPSWHTTDGAFAGAWGETLVRLLDGEDSWTPSTRG